MRASRCIIRGLLLAAMSACLAGCVTGSTIGRAKGYTYNDEKGEEVELKPAPALYALVPLTVPADIVIYPFWCLWCWGRIACGLPPD
jgi:hypothetical protein